MAEQIVGRRGELVALGEFLEAVPAGGSAVLFEGDAGIGKTVLWQEGARLAREGGLRVLRARATQSELRTAFATVADLFAPVLEETLPRLVPVQRRALEVAFLIREPDGPPPEGRLLAAALLSIVRILVEDGPLLVAVDDAQWVDASSAEILRFVFRRLEAERVGVLATVRGRPAEAPLGLDRAFAGFPPAAGRRRSRSGRSTGCCGVGCRSACLGRCSCACTRRWAGTRSSRSRSGARSSTARSAPTASTSSCPRAFALSSRGG